MRSTLRYLTNELRPQTRQARLLYWIGAMLLASAAIHVLVLAASGFDWTGAVSWRKPITFGVSVGLLLETVGWIIDHLRGSRWLASSVAWTLGLSSVAEVGLITLQAWRGEASHFNTLEAGNAMIFALMGVSVGIMSLALLTVFVWSIVRPTGNRLLTLAIVAGMGLMMSGLGIGQWLIELGNDFVAANQVVPDNVVAGAAGEPKFPHAIAFHGIQVFILAALLLNRSNRSDRASLALHLTVIGSYATALVAASIQSIEGAAPGAVTPWSAVMVAATSICGVAMYTILRSAITAENEVGPEPSMAARTP